MTVKKRARQSEARQSEARQSEARQSEALQVKRVGGYVLVKPKKGSGEREEAWLYLHKHSPTQLFIGNMPLPYKEATVAKRARSLSVETQTRIQQALQKMLPACKQVGEVFRTANGRCATRVSLDEDVVDATLRCAQDYVFGSFWGALRDSEEEGSVTKWIEAYERGRDSASVLRWSEAVMQTYEAGERRREELRASSKEGVPDADGFVTVASGGKQMLAAEARTTARRGHGATLGRRAKSGMLLDVSKGIEKVGFYRWQRQKEGVLVELQRKFRDDRKKMAAIRALQRARLAGDTDAEQR